MAAQTGFDQKVLFQQVRELIKGEQFDAARILLIKAIREEKLNASGILKAGNVLARMETPADLQVLMAGQFTSVWLTAALQAFASADQKTLKIEDAPYDNVMQTLVSMNDSTDIVLLLPWTQRLFADGDRLAEERIEDEVSFWQQGWKIIDQKSKSRIIQLGYDWLDCGASGQFLAGQHGGRVDLIRRLNQRLRECLPKNAYFLDLDQIAGNYGKRSFYDSRNYYWTKQPFSEGGVVALGKCASAGLRAITTGPKKLLILDLDNTLWGGVVGELGPHGIEVGGTPAGEAFSDFQHLLKRLNQSGHLLAVCSKNNEADAKEPFLKNANMVLKLEDFAAFKAGWGPKSQAIKEIANELKLGSESFVFFDDSAFEQEEVRSALPEVEVVSVPQDPSDYRSALLDGGWFESVSVTKEDLQRANQYQDEQKRNEIRDTFTNVDEYLTSLGMLADVRKIDEEDLERVVQLIGKTNQFNFTTKRYTREEILEITSRPETVHLTLRLTDKFGDYGLTAVVLAVVTEIEGSKALLIDTWLMSCRTIARTVEHFIFNQLLEAAKKLNVNYLIGNYIPTAKNGLVEDLYSEFGLVPFPMQDHAGTWFKISLTDAVEATTFVHRRVSDGRTSN